MPNELPELLAERSQNETWRPRVFSPSDPSDAAALAALLTSGQVVAVHDRIDDQLEELIACTNPGRRRTAREWDSAKDEACDGAPRWRYGNWVWYPWSARLVHVLPREQFRLVRTDRNRDKITRADQARLLERRIAVIGLSVGNSAALTCAMEGVGGAFRLADHDRLGLSNLNRLRAGVSDLGVEKTVLCARQMAEIDPYLDIEIHRGGVTEETIGHFFDGGPLDLLVEECDTPWVKIAAREHARRLGIPVLMDTNDRGMLDVERFDVEPDRPLLHGRLGATRSEDLSDLDRPRLIRLLLDMVDESQLSSAMTEAIARIGHTLSSWPQLASGVVLGGALVTDTARRILLGHPVPSGRYYVDPEAIITGAGG
ncbi:hypothetical protein GCM10022247_64740 [Allokutzneria multivorans]|uniref:THIF-type NAD/FAD binding fold domain-containing protein n=1 Tax=Allokutzneria multivorans TaxID=1142134 RepID=A0ABP7TSR6_9PSEU